MKQKAAKIATPVLLFFVWLAMNESLSPITVVLGLCVTAFCVVATNSLLDFQYIQTFSLAPISFVKYVLFLLKEIYKSGLRASIFILTGKMRVNVLSFKMNEKVKSEVLRNIVASSITLTPGTITIEQKDGEFIVLAMEEGEKTPAENFEPYMIKMEKTNEPHTDTV